MLWGMLCKTCTHTWNVTAVPQKGLKARLRNILRITRKVPCPICKSVRTRKHKTVFKPSRATCTQCAENFPITAEERRYKRCPFCNTIIRSLLEE